MGAPRPGNGTPDQTRAADARRLLERFATALFVEQHREWEAFEAFVGRPDPNGVRAAAEEVLADNHAELVELLERVREEPLDRHLAKRLARDRFHAVSALLYFMTSKQAKQVQLRLTDGVPLAVCMGDALRIGGRRKIKTVRTLYVEGEISFTPKGCLGIFPDATNGVGEMWPGFCPDCNNTRRKPVRDEERALKKRINAAMRSPKVYAYKLIVPPPPARDDDCTKG